MQRALDRYLNRIDPNWLVGLGRWLVRLAFEAGWNAAKEDW
jgi:hypothetical protein